MNRRTYLHTGALVLAGSVAGCTDLFTSNTDRAGDDDDPADDSDDDRNDTTNSEPDSGQLPEPEVHPAIETVDTYFEAAMAEDLGDMSEVMHSTHPFNPNHFDDDPDITFTHTEADTYERDLVEDRLHPRRILEIPNIEFWFDETPTSLAEVLAGETAALVEIRYVVEEDGERTETVEQLVMLTEDDDWRVFVTYEEPPEIPEGEPTEDETYQVVESVELDSDSEMARIHVSGTSDIVADELRAYSNALRQDSSVWMDTEDTLPSVTFFTVPYDQFGDEIVVSIQFPDEEVVVHREIVGAGTLRG